MLFLDLERAGLTGTTLNHSVLLLHHIGLHVGLSQVQQVLVQCVSHLARVCQISGLRRVRTLVQD